VGEYQYFFSRGQCLSQKTRYASHIQSDTREMGHMRIHMDQAMLASENQLAAQSRNRQKNVGSPAKFCLQARWTVSKAS